MYLISKTDIERNLLDGIQNCYGIDPGGISVPADLTEEPEFKIPPPHPSTIFKNFSSKEKVSIAPGGHKNFYLSEFYSGPINSWADRYFQFQQGDVTTIVGQAAFPPGGTCCLIGLKPTYRTSNTEDIRIECEMEYTYIARLTKARLTPLPMYSFVE